MFCHQINNITKKRKIAEFCRKIAESNKDFVLLLEPFQPQTRITLDISLNIEKQTTSFLHIKNTSQQDVTVNITRRPPPERFIDLSFTSTLIKAESTEVLIITWSPNESGIWWNILQLIVNYRNKYEIPLIMKAEDHQKKNFNKFNKENGIKNTENYIETPKVKQRKKMFNTSINSKILTPSSINLNSEIRLEKSKPRVLDFNISHENNSRRETYPFTPNNNNELKDINFNNSITEKTEEISTSFLLSSTRYETTFVKSTKNFELLTPIAPIRKHNLEFSSSFLSNSSNLESTKSITKEKRHSRRFSLKIRKEVSNSINISNPDPFSVTTTEDPFVSNFSNENWILLQELKFKKWLNALITSSEDFSTETTSVDIGKIWQSSRMKQEILPESKDSISARYHTNMRLNTLRKAASKMFRNNEVNKNLSGSIKCIESKRLGIKKDRDLHRDIGLQKEVLELFLSYNPLWLRIGLETIYGETIPLKSNNDLVGLTRFLLARFFSDPSITKENSHPTIVGLRLPTFTPKMNDFMLTKFLQVIYFLDYAKMNKLIGQDPCLFRKEAPHKESRSILLKFSSEVLGGIGDITRILRLSGYVLKHKQSFMEEFDYAVQDMSLDLRDGVRLCRAMELITGKWNLTCQCSVPANSRAQKVHNVKIALKALLDSGYVLTGEIDARSIAEGHREKTLSLLWQIIYKFQAPRFEKAATCIQNWWRSKSLFVQLKNLLKKRKYDAASVIQRTWRFYLINKKLNQLRENFESSSKAKSVLKIQKWWRRVRETRRKVKAVILVQKIWRAKKLMKEERSKFVKLRKVCLKIQNRWRAEKSKRIEFEKLKIAVLFVQRRWRFLKLMKKEREFYKCILIASRVIQKWWKRLLIMKKDRNNFLLMKKVVLIVEKNWIKKKEIFEERKEFIQKKKSVIVIQRFWRRYRATKNEVFQLQICKKSFITIQSWWRSILIHRKYKIMKKNCIIIQKWWRSLQEIKFCQIQYQRSKNVIVIQKNWRMIKTRRNYQKIKSASMKIQAWFRMKLQKKKFETFLKKHRAAILIQRKWRVFLEKRKFLICQKKAVAVIINFLKAVLRKKQSKDQKIKEIRIEKVETTPKASKSLPVKTLEDKLQESISVFVTSNDLGRLSMCLASLDLITRLSNQSCIIVCKVGLVDKIFETLVRSNRSLPWMDACLNATSILVNLAKYPPTKSFTLEKKYIETLARLLNVTVDKKIQLFLHLATLMWILVEDNEYAKAVLKNYRAVWLLNSLYERVIRKNKRTNQANSKEEEIMPNSEPDWGISQKKPRLFSNIFHATNSIRKRLSKYQD